MQGFTLRSPGVQLDRVLPRHTCDGSDDPPDLDWMHAPQGTQSFVLAMIDEDAGDRERVHWLLYDIPSEVRHLGTEAGPPVGKPGRNDFHTLAYRGPCPPPRGGPHRYVFRLHALSVATLGLEPGARLEQVEEAMQRHLLDTAELRAAYLRK